MNKDSAGVSPQLTQHRARRLVLTWGSLVLAAAESACLFVVGLSGVRVAIGLTSLIAAGGPATGFHRDAIRIPLLTIGTIGALLKLAAAVERASAAQQSFCGVARSALYEVAEAAAHFSVLARHHYLAAGSRGVYYPSLVSPRIKNSCAICTASEWCSPACHRSASARLKRRKR